MTPNARRLLLTTFLLLPGCIMDRVAIQMRYEDQRDDCRDKAEKSYAGMTRNEKPEDNAYARSQKSAELADLFNQCMAQGGWTIATPSKDSAVAQASGSKFNAPATTANGFVAGSALAGRPAPGQRIGSTIESTPQPVRQGQQGLPVSTGSTMHNPSYSTPAAPSGLPSPQNTPMIAPSPPAKGIGTYQPTLH